MSDQPYDSTADTLKHSLRAGELNRLAVTLDDIRAHADGNPLALQALRAADDLHAALTAEIVARRDAEADALRHVMRALHTVVPMLRDELEQEKQAARIGGQVGRG